MSRKYASGSKAWGICGRSGQRMLLKDMIFDGRFPAMRVHPAWWEPKDPLEYAPKLEDPIALWRAAPEDFPMTPPVLEVEQSGIPIDLTWSAAYSPVLNIDGYRVYRRVGDDEETPYTLIATLPSVRDEFGTLTSETLTYSDIGIYIGGQEIFYYVVAYSGTAGMGHSVRQASSNVDSVVYVMPATLTLEGMDGPGTFGLSWPGAVSPCAITSYDLYMRDDDVESEFELYASYPPTTTSVSLPVSLIGKIFKVVTNDSCDNHIDSNEIPTTDEFVLNSEVLLFVSNGNVYSSTNGGVSFAASAVGSLGFSGTMCFEHSPTLGVIVAVSSSPSAVAPQYSLDRGRTWSTCLFNGSTTWPTAGTGGLPSRYIAWHPEHEKFVIFADNCNSVGARLAFLSSDGINFTGAGSSPGDNGQNNSGNPGIAFIDAAWITATGVAAYYHTGLAGGVMVSEDLISWTRIAAFNDGTLVLPATRSRADFNPDTQMVVCCDNNVTAKRRVYPLVSPVQFTACSNTFGMNRAAWASSLGLWTGGGNGVIRYSADGVTWSNGSIVGLDIGGFGINHVNWCPVTGAAFACGAISGPQVTVYRSTNGINWTCVAGAGTGFNPQATAHMVIECPYYTDAP